MAQSGIRIKRHSEIVDELRNLTDVYENALQNNSIWAMRLWLENQGDDPRVLLALSGEQVATRFKQSIFRKISRLHRDAGGVALYEIYMMSGGSLGDVPENLMDGA